MIIRFVQFIIHYGVIPLMLAPVYVFYPAPPRVSAPAHQHVEPTEFHTVKAAR